MDFVHLQCQSEYSVKNSLVRVPDLINCVKEAGMDSVALTDDMRLFSAIKFYQKAINSGIKPIIGAKITVNHDEGNFIEVGIISLVTGSLTRVGFWRVN